MGLDEAMSRTVYVLCDLFLRLQCIYFSACKATKRKRYCRLQNGVNRLFGFFFSVHHWYVVILTQFECIITFWTKHQLIRISTTSSTNCSSHIFGSNCYGTMAEIRGLSIKGFKWLIAIGSILIIWPFDLTKDDLWIKLTTQTLECLASLWNSRDNTVLLCFKKACVTVFADIFFSWSELWFFGDFDPFLSVESVLVLSTPRYDAA